MEVLLFERWRSFESLRDTTDLTEKQLTFPIRLVHVGLLVRESLRKRSIHANQ